MIIDDSLIRQASNWPRSFSISAQGGAVFFFGFTSKENRCGMGKGGVGEWYISIGGYSLLHVFGVSINL